MTIRPSSLDALAKCSTFQPGSSEFAEAGTQRHKALVAHFSGDDSLLDFMDDEQADAVRWAAEYIQLHAPISDYPIQFERTLSIRDPEMKGTPDVVCGNHLFDLKWRYRDYTAQMAAYALMMIAETPSIESVTVHLLFASSQRSEVFTLNKESAWEIVSGIVRSASSPNKKPNPCDYCGWCKLKLTCSAFRERVQKVNDEKWQLECYDMGFVSDGNEMAKALRLARVLSKWCEGVEWRAKELWLKEGVQIPGFELKERKAKQYVTDVTQAFALSGLPQEKFLQCCDLRLNTSKKYPDKSGVIDLYAAQTEISKAGAKRGILKKLDPVLKRGNPTMSLVDTKSNEEEETE